MPQPSWFVTRPDFWHTRHNLRHVVCDEQTRKIVTFAVASLGSILPVGVILNGREFADLVESHYDVNNPKTRAVVDSLRKLP